MTRRPRKSPLPSAWKLARAAWKDFRADWKSYAKILAVVSIPINLLGLSTGLATDPSMNAYTTIAAIIMNVALIWAIVQSEKTGKAPGISSSYYDGSVAIVRFLLITVALVLMLIPAAFGAAIYLASLSAIDASVSLPEQLLISAVCLLIALPSVWMIIRFGLAPIAAIDTGLPPVASLRYARKLTLGRFWRTLARYAMLALYLIALAVPIALVTAGMSYLKLGPVPTVFFQLTTTLTALPLANLYLLHLMRSLEPKTDPAA